MRRYDDRRSGRRSTSGNAAAVRRQVEQVAPDRCPKKRIDSNLNLKQSRQVLNVLENNWLILHCSFKRHTGRQTWQLLNYIKTEFEILKQKKDGRTEPAKDNLYC